MEFSRQEYSSGLPFPTPGDLPDPGIKLRSPALQADSLPSKQPGKLMIHLMAPHFFFLHIPLKYIKKQKLWLHITIAIETNSLATVFQYLGEIHTHLYRTSMCPHPQLKCPHSVRQSSTRHHCLSLCASLCITKSVHHCTLISISEMQKWEIWHPPPHSHSKETVCYTIQNDFGSPLTFISIDSFSKMKV